MTRLDHLLWVVSEECDEVGQRASKAARFGVGEIQPGQRFTNAERIVEEYYQLLGAIEMLVEEGAIVLNPMEMRNAMDIKKATMEKYLAYSQSCGRLDPTPSSSGSSS